MVEGFCTHCIVLTTSEPTAGNRRPGAPVKASMSGSPLAATRVEPWNTVKTMYPTPDLFGGRGIFLTASEK